MSTSNNVQAFVPTTGLGPVSNSFTDLQTAIEGDLLLAAPLESPTFTGTVTIPTPTSGDSSTQAATTAFVQTAIEAVSAGRQDKAAVIAATTAALPAYTVVGNILTASANAVFSADDINTWTDVDNDGGSLDPYASGLKASSVTVKDEPDQTINGIYSILDKGSDSTPWKLQRREDANDGSELVQGSTALVLQGTVNANTTWTMNAANPIVIGTTNITWAKTGSGSGGSSLTAGYGIDITSNVVSTKYGKGVFPTTAGTLPLGQLVNIANLTTSATFILPEDTDNNIYVLGNSISSTPLTVATFTPPSGFTFKSTANPTGSATATYAVGVHETWVLNVATSTYESLS